MILELVAYSSERTSTHLIPFRDALIAKGFDDISDIYINTEHLSSYQFGFTLPAESLDIIREIRTNHPTIVLELS